MEVEAAVLHTPPRLVAAALTMVAVVDQVGVEADVNRALLEVSISSTDRQVLPGIHGQCC